MTVWLRRFDSFKAETEGDAKFWHCMTPDQHVAVVEQLKKEWFLRSGRVDEGFRRTIRRLRSPRR